jgi:CRISPR-associated endonuclease Cas2
MAMLLVTYDLNKPGKDYNDVLKTIKSYSWARLSESSYAIKTEQTPQQVFDKLKPYLDQNDNLYIINLKKPYAGYGPKEVNEWLDNGLSY